MTDEPEDPQTPDEPDPNLITTKSWGPDESETEDKDEPKE